jgi:GST-like protein
MIELYACNTSNGQRGAVMLAEAGLAFNTHILNLKAGEHKTPEFRKINPVGAVPVIIDPDGPDGKPLTLAQTGAICLYVAEKTGQFLPQDMRTRFIAFQYFMQAMSDVVLYSGAYAFSLMRFPEPNVASTKVFKDPLLEHMGYFDQRLADVEFLAGEISIADIALYPAVNQRWGLIEERGGLSNLNRWRKMMAARPGITRGMQAVA